MVREREARERRCFFFPLNNNNNGTPCVKDWEVQEMKDSGM